MKTFLLLIVVLLIAGGAYIYTHPKQFPMFERVVAETEMPDIKEVSEVRKEEKYEVVLAAQRMPITEAMYNTLKGLWDDVNKRFNPINNVKEKLGLSEEVLDNSPEFGVFRVNKTQFDSFREGSAVTWRLSAGMNGWTPVFYWQGVWVKKKMNPETSYAWVDQSGNETAIQQKTFELILNRIGRGKLKSEPGLTRYFRTKVTTESVLVIKNFECEVYFDDPKTMNGITVAGYSLFSGENEKWLRNHQLKFPVVAPAGDESGFALGKEFHHGENGFWSKVVKYEEAKPKI